MYMATFQVRFVQYVTLQIVGQQHRIFNVVDIYIVVLGKVLAPVQEMLL
jgi:lipoprotein signal peptidase